MKVARYSASGTTHSNGADTTSVARCCVTPSSKRGRHQRQHDPQRTRAGQRLTARSPRLPAAAGSCARRDLRQLQPEAHALAYAHAGDERRDSPERHRPADRLHTPRRDRLDEQICRAAPAGFRRCSRRRESTDRRPRDRSFARTSAAGAGRSPRARRTAGRRCRPARRSTHHRGSAPPGSPMSIGSGSMTLAAISTPTCTGHCHRRRDARAQRVRVEISEQQHGLEEDQAGAPDRGAAAEDRQQNLPDQGLHHEEQRRGEEDREREERFMRRRVRRAAGASQARSSVAAMRDRECASSLRPRRQLPSIS